jgi:hypothetical protein
MIMRQLYFVVPEGNEHIRIKDDDGVRQTPMANIAGNGKRGTAVALLPTRLVRRHIRPLAGPPQSRNRFLDLLDTVGGRFLSVEREGEECSSGEGVGSSCGKTRSGSATARGAEVPRASRGSGVQVPHRLSREA